MKQSDIITAVLVAVLGFVAAFWLCNVLLGNPDEFSIEFQTIDEVSNKLDEPNKEVFNSQAINPTIEVFVGQCEDVDHNGIIDDAEWSACHNDEE